MVGRMCLAGRQTRQAGGLRSPTKKPALIERALCFNEKLLPCLRHGFGSRAALRKNGLEMTWRQAQAQGAAHDRLQNKPSCWARPRAYERREKRKLARPRTHVPSPVDFCFIWLRDGARLGCGDLDWTRLPLGWPCLGSDWSINWNSSYPSSCASTCSEVRPHSCGYEHSPKRTAASPESPVGCAFHLLLEIVLLTNSSLDWVRKSLVWPCMDFNRSFICPCNRWKHSRMDFRVFHSFGCDFSGIPNCPRVLVYVAVAA